MKVGLVSPYDLSVPGGVQAQVLGLSRFLQDRGDEAMVIGPGLPQGVRGVDLGGSVRIPGNGSMVPISLDPRARGRLREAGAALDLLHVHEPLMPLVSLLANHAGPPVVATFHAAAGPAVGRAYRMAGPLLEWGLGNTVAVTAVSQAAASVLPPALAVRIIPNGVDIASARVDVPRNPHLVAFLGRDEPRKGLDVLLAAWPKIRRDHRDAELVVMNARRDLAGVDWLGVVDEGTKRRVLSSATVFVAPHLGGESFGIVLLEAMAAGAAVVASDLAAFEDLAAGAARFFRAGDGAALAAAVLDVLDDPESQHRLTTAGAVKAAGYDWSVVGAAYRDVYLASVS